MTGTIEDHQLQEVDAPRADQAGPARSRLPIVIAVGGAAVVVVAAAIAFWPSSSPKPPIAPTGFASGTTVDLVLSCPGAEQPCAGGITAPDGTQWFWSTEVGQSIPSTWQSEQVTGQLVTDGDWGTVTYTAGGQSVPLLGGMATPEHSFFG